MAEPQRLQPVRMYEGGDEIDPQNKTTTAPPPAEAAKTIHDYYVEVSGGVRMQDVATGAETSPDGDPLNDAALDADAEPPMDPPVTLTPAVAPAKPEIAMKIPAPVAADDLARATDSES